MNEAFVYCWTDTVAGKLYVGYHVGRPDDGYICSSKHFLAEYNKRPNDFTRSIIAIGQKADIRRFEAKILEAAKAASNDHFYNKHNGSGKFCTTNESHAKTVETRKAKGWFYNKEELGKKISTMLIGTKHTTETKKNMSLAKKQARWFYNPETNKTTFVKPGNEPSGFIRGRK